MNSGQAGSPQSSTQNVQQQEFMTPAEKYNLKSLTPEDRQVLNAIQKEAAFKRGYPLAALLGGLTYVAIGKRFPSMNMIGRIGLSTLAGCTGNVIGKITYIPQALQKLEIDLPPESVLREYITKARQQYNESSLSQKHAPYSNLDSVQHDQSIIPPIMSSEDSNHDTAVANNEQLPTFQSAQNNQDNLQNKYTSYGELRKVHREKEKSWQSPSGQSLQPDIATDYGDISAEPKQRVRYNKYGDPILE